MNKIKTLENGKFQHIFPYAPRREKTPIFYGKQNPGDTKIY